MVEIGLQELEAKIREDGEREIKGIKAETEKRVYTIKRDIQRTVDERVDKIRKAGEMEMEMVRRRIIADANIKARELIIVEKNGLVDRVFEKAGESILNLNDNEKKGVLKNLTEGGKKNIKDPLILVDGKYKNLLEGAEASNLNDFGVIVMSKDKKLRIDNTLGSRLKQLKTTLKPKVASILFTENGEITFDR